MSNITSTAPKPQAPQAAPDGNAVASLILGILGITVIPVILSILAVIIGRASIDDAYKRGERGSAMATAGVILGWIGVAVAVVAVVALAIVGLWRLDIFLAVFVILGIILGISAWVIYSRRNSRR